MRNAPRELLELLGRELWWQRVLRELDQAIAAVTRRLGRHSLQQQRNFRRRVFKVNENVG